MRVLDADSGVLALRRPKPGSATDRTFSSIWERHVMPLAGRTLRRPDGETNTIVAVDWGGVKRITSTGATGRIKIEIFEWAVNRLFAAGSVSRDAINQEYVGRASRGVVLILAQVPFFERTSNPDGLRLRGAK